jgi:hypothetical protein
MSSTSLNIRVRGPLLVPFGRPKWDISKITISSVSTDSSYFKSDTPCAYIDVGANSALRLHHIENCLPEFPADAVPFDQDEGQAALKTLQVVKESLLTSCNYDSDFEKRFLELYFKWIVERCSPKEWQCRRPRSELTKPNDDPWWFIEALLPLPQAHLYVHDPLSGQFQPAPKTMFKVDFAFWTGKQFIAIELDGKSHIGDEKHVTKDRMLQRAGVHVIHILNKELMEYGTKVMDALLPDPVSHFWRIVDKPNGYPFVPF